MREVDPTGRHLRNVTIIRAGSLSRRHVGRKRWQSAFHKVRFIGAVPPTDYRPIIPVLGRDGACNWPAIPDDEGSGS
jgi:hypothetical protein